MDPVGQLLCERVTLVISQCYVNECETGLLIATT